MFRWLPFDPSRNWPDLGPRFARGERLLRDAIAAAKPKAPPAVATTVTTDDDQPVDTARNPVPPRRGPGGLKPTEAWGSESVEEDNRDLSWSTVLKRTFEAYLRGERPNMYGEWINWQ